MPVFEIPFWGEPNFKHLKQLISFWKARNLFQGLASLDKDVEGSFRKNHQLSFRYQLDTGHSILSTKLFKISTKPSEILPSKISVTPRLRRPLFNSSTAVMEPWERPQGSPLLRISKMWRSLQLETYPGPFPVESYPWSKPHLLVCRRTHRENTEKYLQRFCGSGL